MDNSENIFINNSGLILTYPFLPTFFTQSGILADNLFKDVPSQNRAVYLLQYLVSGDVDFSEDELVLNKILVGMPLGIQLEPGIELTDEEKNLCHSLLKGMLQNWEKLGNTSIEGLQEAFLKREGLLAFEDAYVTLNVEKKGIDILLDSIPWNINMVKLPWIDKAIQINWR